MRSPRSGSVSTEAIPSATREKNSTIGLVLTAIEPSTVKNHAAVNPRARRYLCSPIPVLFASRLSASRFRVFMTLRKVLYVHLSSFILVRGLNKLRTFLNGNGNRRPLGAALVALTTVSFVNLGLIDVCK